jgi:hypothetical protein
MQAAIKPNALFQPHSNRIATINSIMADNNGTRGQDDITLEQATAFQNKHFKRDWVDACPAILPFLAPFVVSKNSDGQDALFATTPNCNHNILDIKTALEMCNTVLGNPMNLSKENNPEFQHDMKFYIVNLNSNCKEGDVSDLSRNQA